MFNTTTGSLISWTIINPYLVFSNTWETNLLIVIIGSIFFRFETANSGWIAVWMNFVTSFLSRLNSFPDQILLWIPAWLLMNFGFEITFRFIRLVEGNFSLFFFHGEKHRSNESLFKIDDESWDLFEFEFNHRCVSHFVITCA